MNKNNFIKCMLSLLLGLVCNVVWAQTYTPNAQKEMPVDGYYLMYSESSSGEGWIHYNGSLDRKYRVATDVDLNTGVTTEQSQYIWRLVKAENNTFTLQCLANGVYMPADAARNGNMSATAAANLALTAVEGKEGFWYVSQTNNTHSGASLYIHTNSPGGYPNLSYWDGCSVDGTSIRAQFYKVDIPEVSYTLNFMFEGEKISDTTISLPKGFDAFAESVIKNQVPAGYYMVSSSLSETTYTVNVAVDIRPVPGKKYYIFNKHQSGYQYYYDNNGSVGFANACAYNDKDYIWLCEANGDKLNFKNVSTGKYFAWQSLSANAYGWNVSAEKGTGKVVNDGCLTLQNSGKTRYLVGKIGTFDQADKAGYDDATFSSDFCFIEYTHKPQPGKYYYFYNKHLKGDKYFYDNNGSVGFSATKDAFNKNYIWLCEEDANTPGMVTFKNLGTNRYFVWQGLSATALAWTVDETVGNEKVVNEGCVTLRANQTGSNVLVVKNATGWDLSTRAGYYDETYSSDYCFEEFSALPQDGHTYFIYNDNDTPLYLNNSNGTLKANEGKHLMDSYLFVCQKYGDTYRFKNLAGKWLAHKSLDNNAHGFKVTTTDANNFGCATLWTENIGDGSGRFLCIENNGGMNQAQEKTNKNNSNYSTDFVFVQCRETANILTINLPVYVNAKLTVNGKEYTASMSVELTSGVAPVIDITHENQLFAFAGFIDADGNAYDVANLANATQNIELTANFVPTFISETYGEKWVRFTNCSNTSYSAGLEIVEGEYVDSKGKTAIMDFSAENQLWCLVGTYDNFILYNKAAGENYALNVPIAENSSYANGTESKMAADKGAWKIKSGHYGIALVPIAKTNASELAVNMYGGNGGYLKLYTTGKEDKGSYWTPTLIDVTKSISVDVTVNGEAWDARHGVAQLILKAGGLTSSTHVVGNTMIDECYLPKDEPFSLTSNTYRGYTFSGFGGTYENVTLTQNLELSLSYTANDERTLFYSPRDGHPYRIPAIATAPNGDIFAICDYRPCGNDIGYGEVDLVCRVSSDNGVTWTDERTIADGLGHINDGIWKMGFGDPAIVADRESNKVLVMSVCGNRTCWDGNYGEENANPNRVSRLYITYDEAKKEWVYGEPEEVTDAIYPKFVDSDGNVHAASLFIGAGKICQSRVVKKDKYYRLYCAVWNVTKTQRQHHNYVIYSDDFGETWNVLGDLGYSNSPAPAGNEPKCEELPDGTVVLSSRVSGGRFFNLFTFTDNTYTTGFWGSVAKSTETYDGSSQGTNGEIYKVKAIRKADGKICDVMLQSVPAGPGRSNVKVYYKEMEYNADGTNKYTPATFATGWAVGKQVSQKESCYSTMILQADGRIGFFFEEVPGGYCMVYIPYTLDDLTDNKYSLYTVNSTIGEHGIGTFYASEAMQIPEGVKAYVVTEEPVMKEGTGYIKPEVLEGIIPANTGAILMGDADTYNFTPSISYGTPVNGNMLVGYEAADNKSDIQSAVTLPVSSTVYVLAVEDEKAGFYKKEAGFYVRNNKAYLQIPGVQSARCLVFDFGGETGVDEVKTENGNVKTDMYDLAGRRVKKAQKGVYIVNGKVQVVK